VETSRKNLNPAVIPTAVVTGVSVAVTAVCLRARLRRAAHPRARRRLDQGSFAASFRTRAISSGSVFFCAASRITAGIAVFGSACTV